MSAIWRHLLIGFAAALAFGWPGRALAGLAEHVVVVVWDGMRPDFVTREFTPTLDALARRGVFFRNHHSSYVSSTEVNGAALATGMYPKDNGILANVEHRPELSWLGSFGTENLDAIRRGDLLTDGHYLEADTVPEILQRAGFTTIIAGAKPVVLLQDRAPEKESAAQKGSVTLFRGLTFPKSLRKTLVAMPEIGPFPTDSASGDTVRAKTTRWFRKGQDRVFLELYGIPRMIPVSRLIDAWTTRAVVNGLWHDGVPKYTLLWLSEPDASQHQSGPGSPNAVEGLAQCDQNLALLLNSLKEKALLERTDVLVVSDHGFSTIERAPDLIAAIKKAGVSITKQYENPDTGDVLAIPLGGSMLFYVFNHDSATIQRLVEVLQSNTNVGVIFSALEIQGTFPLSQVRLDAKRGAPDVVVSMRWNDDKNTYSASGLLQAPEGRRGRGTHASLSPFDLHNTLIAAGPDFKTGLVSEMPSGNIDVAPTVLNILGVAPSEPMDGRVLSEGMTGTNAAPPKAESQTFEAARDLGTRTWRQWLKVSRVGPTVYFDQGLGESKANK